jgi:hypothetical protein
VSSQVKQTLVNTKFRGRLILPRAYTAERKIGAGFYYQTEPSFFVVALCFVLMLCCFSGFLVTARQAGSTKYEACARSRWLHAHGADGQQQQADAPASQKSGLFVALGQAQSTKHEHKAANFDKKM